jgi:poly(ADP-ribose) glycohydrolase ARH3
MFADEPTKLAEQVRLQSLVTHRHPLGVEGAQIIARVVSLALAMDRFDRDQFLAQLRPICIQAEFAAHHDRLRTLPSHKIGELGNGIEATESVMTAVACFLHWPESFTDAVGNAILLGGDTDTIAAMTGAISGAYLGIDAIPLAVLPKIENEGKGRDYIMNLADRLFARSAALS